MYEDFNAVDFGQTLKAGLVFALNKSPRWSVSPSVQFPVNPFTSSTNLKSDVGFELAFRYESVSKGNGLARGGLIANSRKLQQPTDFPPPAWASG
jgi:hypothetical protein